MSQEAAIQLNSNLEIESGHFKNHYLVYNRKSTDEPDNQKNSIMYQKSENSRFASRERLPVANVSIEGFCINGIISEKHSAFKEDLDLIIGENGVVQYKIERPKFHKLIQYLNNGKFNGVIVLCWDRISRNKGDETIIRKLMKSGIDFRFVLATYDNTSSGALHMDIDGMFAEHHSRVTSEKVRLNIRNQRDKGICTYKAPVGYLNMGTMEDKPIDPRKAPIIKKLFELYATGEWSLASLSKWATEQGFVMSASRRKKTSIEKQLEEEGDMLVDIKPIERIVTFTSLQRILTNPFYIGKIIGNNGELITSNSHKPIISEELFNAVQIELKRKKVSTQYLNRIQLPFRGLVRCGDCNRLYTPYMKKGKLYLGSRCPSGCANTLKNCNLEFISTRVIGIIEKLTFTDDELFEIDNRANTDIAILETKRFNQIDLIEKQKKKIREDLAYLNSNKLNLLRTGVYSPESLRLEEDTLNQKLFKLQDSEQISNMAMQETVREVEKLSELLKSLKCQYIFANPYENEGIVKLLFSELSIMHKSLTYQCKDGIKALESRFVTPCELTEWLSELPSLSKYISHCIDNIEARLNKTCD